MQHTHIHGTHQHACRGARHDTVRDTRVEQQQNGAQAVAVARRQQERFAALHQCHELFNLHKDKAALNLLKLM